MRRPPSRRALLDPSPRGPPSAAALASATPLVPSSPPRATRLSYAEAVLPSFPKRPAIDHASPSRDARSPTTKSARHRNVVAQRRRSTRSSTRLSVARVAALLSNAAISPSMSRPRSACPSVVDAAAPDLSSAPMIVSLRGATAADATVAPATAAQDAARPQRTYA